MEMELCGSQAALVTVTNLCKELKNRQQQKNEEMRRLEEKHKQISQFRDMMVSHFVTAVNSVCVREVWCVREAGVYRVLPYVMM